MKGWAVAKTMGYLITWTTYGSWVQGDERGYVKDGRICQGDELLKAVNRRQLRGKMVELSARQRHQVQQAIADKAREKKRPVLALAVGKTNSRSPPLKRWGTRSVEACSWFAVA